MDFYVLVDFNKIIHVSKQGLYWDDGLIVLDKRKWNDRIRKKIFKLFKELGFDIEVEINLKVVQYLDVELNHIRESTYLEELPLPWNLIVGCITI